MLKENELNEFIKYIQKRCTTSAEKARNESIEKLTI